MRRKYLLRLEKRVHSGGLRIWFFGILDDWFAYRDNRFIIITTRKE